jgi:hypothetical protein
MPTPRECPVCGDPVPPRAKACPGCGADERTGWDEETARYAALDLPAYEDDDAAPAAPRQRPLRRSLHPLWWLVALVLLLLSIAYVVTP